MRVNLVGADGARTYVVVLDPGDEAVSGLRQFAADTRVDAAHLTAIGAFESSTLGWFDLDRRDYRRNEVQEQAEVVSLVGDITCSPGDASSRTVHAHCVLGLPDGRALGGHLLRGLVRPTLEVVVTESPGTLRRRFDQRTGLALIDLAAGSGPAGPTPGDRDDDRG